MSEIEGKISMEKKQGAIIDFLITGLADAAAADFFSRLTMLVAIRKYKREYPDHIAFEEGGEIERFLDNWISEVEEEAIREARQIQSRMNSANN